MSTNRNIFEKIKDAKQAIHFGRLLGIFLSILFLINRLQKFFSRVHHIFNFTNLTVQ